MTIAWTPPLLDGGLDDGALWNAVVALSGQTIPLSDAGATFSFSLTETPASEAWLASAELEGVSGPFFLHVREFPFRAMFDVDLAVADISGLPEGLRQALLEGMFAAIGALLPPEQSARLRLREQGLAIAFPELGRGEMQWFSVRLSRPDGLAIDLDIACRHSTATRLLAHIKPLDSPVHAELAEKIPVSVDATIGGITIAHGYLAMLEPGAVVVMAEQQAGTCRMRVQDSLFDFVGGEEGWRCLGVRPVDGERSFVSLHRDKGESVMDEEAQPEEAAEPSPVADLRIAVDFDIGRMVVPFSALSRWREGAVVELDPPVAAEGLEVTIRANGDVIGSGDIVRIDDRIAVRITRFSPRR